jgi:cysteine desulfuration protein SufE
MNTDKIQDAIIEEFSMFDDWLDKYDYLISLSESLPMIDPAKRTERYLIEGCQSRVWVASELKEGKVLYSADSDAIITKGIIALLIRVMNGRTPEELAHIDLYFIDAIGLGENLSPTRSNGLRAMISQMKLDALVYTQQQNNA